MSELTSAERSWIMRSAWRRRKRKGGRGVCTYCHHTIWIGGVVYDGRKYHKSCLESAKAGLTRKQAGVGNPRKGIEGFYYMDGKFISRESPSKKTRDKVCKALNARVVSVSEFTHSVIGPSLRIDLTSKQAKSNPRPPAAWFSRMAARVAAHYPRERGESLASYRKSISKIVAGIWYNFSAATRKRLIRKYG